MPRNSFNCALPLFCPIQFRIYATVSQCELFFGKRLAIKVIKSWKTLVEAIKWGQDTPINYSLKRKLGEWEDWIINIWKGSKIYYISKIILKIINIISPFFFFFINFLKKPWFRTRVVCVRALSTLPFPFPPTWIDMLSGSHLNVIYRKSECEGGEKG